VLLARIPKRFYDTCVKYDLPVPVLQRETLRNYFIDLAATDIEDLCNFMWRANLISTTDLVRPKDLPLQQSARATRAGLKKGLDL